MAFIPKDLNFEQRGRETFGKQGAMRSFGVELISLEAGRIVFEMPFHPDFSQQHGFIHGGVISAVMDSSCGFAAMSLLPDGWEILTVEFKINFLSPAKGERFRFIGEVLKPGRTLTVSEAKAYAIDQGQEKLIASMNATMMGVHNRNDVTQTSTNSAT